MKKTTAILLAILFSLGLGYQGYAQTGTEILKKLDQVMFSAKDLSAKNKIIITSKSGKQEVRESTVIQKGQEMRLFRFTSPASQAGIAMLSLPNDVMYIYLPSFGKERRISSSVKSQKFAGTDFSYDDMQAQPFSDKYNAKLIETTDKYYVLELTPKTKSAYSKIIAKIHKTEYYPISTDLYDQKNEKIKETTYTFAKVGKYWSASEITMFDLKKGSKTQIQMIQPKYDQGLSDDEFTIRKLIN